MDTTYTIDGHDFIVTFNASNLMTQIVVPDYKDPNTGEPLTITFGAPVPFTETFLEQLEYLLFGS